MKFYFTSADTEANIEYAAKYENVVFACTACGSERTSETDELVPSGVHHKVRCEKGHVTNGMPPAAHRATTREQMLQELADAKAAAKAKRAANKNK